VAPSRADLNSEAICKARHQVVFTKRGSNVASGSRTDLCGMRPGAVARVMPEPTFVTTRTAHLVLTLCSLSGQRLAGRLPEAATPCYCQCQ